MSVLKVLRQMPMLSEPKLVKPQFLGHMRIKKRGIAVGCGSIQANDL